MTEIVWLHAREVLETRDRLNRILSKHTGQTVEKIGRDTERDNFMSAAQAVEYGLIYEVLITAKKKPEKSDKPDRPDRSDKPENK